MKLQISANSLRNTYPDLWEASWLQAQELCKLQSKVLAEFPEYYKQLPDTLEHYIQLRSLFSYVEALWLRLAKQYKRACKSLEEPCEQIPDAVLDLKSLLIEIQALPLERFVFKTEDGLLDFERIVNQFSERLVFVVINPYMYFDDLMGLVKKYGISYQGILDSALSDSYPEQVTVGDNLEKVLFSQIIQHDLIGVSQRSINWFC